MLVRAGDLAEKWHGTLVTCTLDKKKIQYRIIRHCVCVCGRPIYPIITKCDVLITSLFPLDTFSVFLRAVYNVSLKKVHSRSMHCRLNKDFNYRSDLIVRKNKFSFLLVKNYRGAQNTKIKRARKATYKSIKDVR